MVYKQDKNGVIGGRKISVLKQPGTTFDQKLNSAIAIAAPGELIDCRDMVGAWDQAAPVVIDVEDVTVLLGNCVVTFDNADGENMFEILVNGVSIIGQGRGSRGVDENGKTRLVMENSTGAGDYGNGAGNHGYHVYGRDSSRAVIKGIDFVGVQSGLGEQEGSASPLTGCGGICLEPSSPEGANYRVEYACIADVLMSGAKACGVMIYAPRHCDLNNVRVEDAGTHGLFMWYGSNVSVRGCVSVAANLAGAFFRESDAVFVDGGRFSSGGLGVWFDYVSAGTVVCVVAETGDPKGADPWPSLNAGTKIFTKTSGGSGVEIVDVGNTYRALFNGTHFVATHCNSTTFMNCSSEYVGDTSSVYTADFLVDGLSRQVLIYNPRILSVFVFPPANQVRFHFRVSSNYGGTPLGTELVFDCENNSAVVPTVSGEYVTDQDSGSHEAPVYDVGTNTVVRWGRSQWYAQRHMVLAKQAATFSADWAGSLNYIYNEEEGSLVFTGSFSTPTGSNAEITRLPTSVPPGSSLIFIAIVDSNSNTAVVRYDTASARRLMFMTTIVPSRTYYINAKVYL